MTKVNNPVQIVDVELPFGLVYFPLHCPICGQLSQSETAGEVTPCPHLAFIHVDEVGEYEYQSPAFASRMAPLASNVDDEDEAGEPLAMTLARAGYGNELLALRITSSGIACGPASCSVTYGFDYGTLEANEEDR